MGKSNQFKILREDDESEWQFNSQKFSDALIKFRDEKNSQLPKVDGHRAHEWSLSRIYKEIEAKYNITEGAMKQWKAGNNGPGNIESVKDCAKYLEIDYHDLLEPVNPEKSDIDLIGLLKSLIKENIESMTEDKKFVCWVYEQCTELVWLDNTYIPEGTDRESRLANKTSVIRMKETDIHSEISKKTLMFSDQFCNKLHKIVYEVGNCHDCCDGDAPYRESIQQKMVYDTLFASEYWYYPDRTEYILMADSNDVSWVESYIRYEEIDWLEEMDIDDYKPIDEEFGKIFDTLYEGNVNQSEREALLEELLSYGAGSSEYASIVNPRTVAFHLYCKDLRLVFKHDFPEIDW